jgi:hypothetical protein
MRPDVSFAPRWYGGARRESRGIRTLRRYISAASVSAALAVGGGLIFPPFPYGVENLHIRPLHLVWGQGKIETEGFGIMARDTSSAGGCRTTKSSTPSRAAWSSPPLPGLSPRMNPQHRPLLARRGLYQIAADTGSISEQQSRTGVGLAATRLNQVESILRERGSLVSSRSRSKVEIIARR